MQLIRNSRASANLDMLRGLAAAAVFANHARSLFFVDFAEVLDEGPITRGLYFATTLGHQAVVVFFVLSGFLIGSSVARNLDHWSWKDYAVDRLTRLYIVLLPAIVATAGWDAAGIALGNTAIYDGNAGGEIIRFAVRDRLDGYHFLVSSACCQTILAPAFGSNSPLWSLANEFWYYVLFPLGVLILRPSTAVLPKLVYAALAVAISWFVGQSILMLFPVWLAGAAIRWAPAARRTYALRVAVIGVGFVVAGLCAATALKQIPANVADYALGGTVALWVYLMAHDNRPSNDTRLSRCYARFARELAGVSYTLYLVHIPALIFLRSLLLVDARWQPDGYACVRMTVIALGLIGYVWLFAKFTERNTDRVRVWLKQRFGSTNIRSVAA